jgi:hypothetical protein
MHHRLTAHFTSKKYYRIVVTIIATSVIPNQDEAREMGRFQQVVHQVERGEASTRGNETRGNASTCFHSARVITEHAHSLRKHAITSSSDNASLPMQ